MVEKTITVWALVLVFYMSLTPRCACHCGVFRVPLTLKHDFNVTAMHPLHATNEVGLSTHHAPHKDNMAAVETTPFFTGPIVLGHQQFEVVFDTGSNDLWVFGKNVDNDGLSKDGYDHHYYNYKEERATGEPFKEVYGEDEREFTRVSGVNVLDTLNVGDIEMDVYRFGVVNKIEIGESMTTRYDGIMGLGYEANGSPSKSVFTSMVRQHLLRAPMFSVYMAEDRVRGEILFGSYDDRYFKYPIEVNDAAMVDGDGNGMWMVKVMRLALGNVYLDRRRRIRQGAHVLVWALVDTGCTNMHLPLELLNEARQRSETLKDALDRRSGTYGYVPCSSRTFLPPLKLAIGTRDYLLTGEDYTTTLGSVRGGNGQEWCRLEIDDGAPDRKTMIIGGPFFRKYYTMFYYEYDGFEGPVVTFAEAKRPSREA